MKRLRLFEWRRMPPGMLPLLVFLGLLACIAVFGPMVDELIYKAEDQWYARHHSQSRWCCTLQATKQQRSE